VGTRWGNRILGGLGRLRKVVSCVAHFSGVGHRPGLAHLVTAHSDVARDLLRNVNVDRCRQ
jgi:hypothetical protein